MAKRVFKTKRKVSRVAALYRKWGDWEQGDYIIGKYIKEVQDNYKKPNWLIEVEEAEFSNRKEAKKFIGKVIGLNSSGGLDRAMEDVQLGEIVQVTYEGMEEMDGGPYKGKDKHIHDVQVVVEEGSEDDTDDSDEDEDDEADEDEDEDDL